MTLFDFDNRYARLPERLYARLDPTSVAAPRLIHCNDELCDELGIDAARLRGDSGVAALAGNRVPDGAEPLAQAYAGHQFGGFVPQLGDGRAILLGEVIGRHGQHRDIQLKGAGPTPWSRRGDGRAALGPVLREYLLSEAMHALGVPTTRGLAAIATGERVLREEPLPGALLVRVASSHVRVGTFQFFAVRDDLAALRVLLDFVIERHYPEAKDADNPALALIGKVMERQAALVARWLGVGFVHGVMNTDNTSISGETIDYGPCAFIDRFDPAMVFSSIDPGGRYAYGAQSGIIGWNLVRLAEALLPVVDPRPDVAIAAAQQVVEGFPPLMEAAWLDVMRAKLGLATACDDDRELVEGILSIMEAAGADFTNTFRALCDAADGKDAAVRSELDGSERYDGWAEGWRARLADDGEEVGGAGARMRRANPGFIARNHLVEEVLAAALEGDDEPFRELATVLSRPYDDQPGAELYREPAPASAPPYRTFCGT